MRWRAVLRRQVVDTTTAETVGQVDTLVLDPVERRVRAVVVRGADPGLLDVEEVAAFGKDAVTVEGREALRRPRDERDEGAADGELDPLGKQVLTEDGDLLGVVADVEFDAETGAVDSIVMADDRLAAGRLLGVGPFAVVVRARRRADDDDSDDLGDLTKSELYELAKERDIDGRSTMDKAELLTALRAV